MRFICYIDGVGAKSLWVWKFLFTKTNNSLTLGFYWDYENLTFHKRIY